jgi:hypothetical protein
MSNPIIEYVPNVWNTWTESTGQISFQTQKKCVGNGEEKLAAELKIETKLGGQNNTVDLFHPTIGKISVKDMTSDDCTLGTEGCQHLRRMFRKIVYPLSCWCEKYCDSCDYASSIWKRLNTTYGRSRTTLFEGIERFELSSSNFQELNRILEELKFRHGCVELFSLKSEYIMDICSYMKSKTLLQMSNECVQREAIDMTLIIVHESKGWMIVKDLERITCPRITRGAPRIHIDYDKSNDSCSAL